MIQNIKPKLWFRFGVLCAAFLVFALGFYIIVNNFFSSDLRIPEGNFAFSFSASHIYGIPLKLTVPSIHVNASIEPMGLTKDGAMATPEEPAKTGWYSYGPRPGEKGSSVIAGHRGFKTGPAVFDNLHKIKTGDEVRVLNEDGKELVFIVRETRIYGAKEIVPEVWNKEDMAHLNLITCSGKWNRLTRTSDERLVVFTDLAS